MITLFSRVVSCVLFRNASQFARAAVLLCVGGVAALLSGCGPENSDGSDATTYSSCSITDSAAAFADDRAKDVSQCWDGVDYEEKSLALDWCEQQVSNYIASEYVFGHSVEFRVASTNCP